MDYKCVLFLLLNMVWCSTLNAHDVGTLDWASTDSCDVVELNTYVKYIPIFDKDDPTKLVQVKTEVVFKQFIAWDYDGDLGRYVVRGWRLYKGKQHEHPIKDGKGWRIRWDNNQFSTTLRFKTYIESETEEDVEQLNRKVVADNRRKGILDPNIKIDKSIVIRRRQQREREVAYEKISN